MSVPDVALSPIREVLARSACCINGRFDLCSGESIVIYLALAGSMSPMGVLDSDLVASVKLRIQTCKGFEVRRQKLVFGGRELARNESLVKDYGLSSGDVLHLVLRLSDPLVITPRTSYGEEFELFVDRHRNAQYLNRRTSKERRRSSGFADHEFLCDCERLDDQRLIGDISTNSETENWNKTTNGVPLEKNDLLLEPVQVNLEVELPCVIRSMIDSAFDGLKAGKMPVRSSEGTGGAYFMQNAAGNEYVAIFKPMDEEPMAVNNPQGLPLSSNGEGLKRGTVVGEGALREVAAFILDHPKSGPRLPSNGEIGFAGVPPTALIRCLHNGFNHPGGYEPSARNIKIGSLQMFAKNCGTCEDMGPSNFPIEEVHKISVLDIRMANADRHAGNILVNKEGDNGKIVLIPIDHGYCLPEDFEDCTFDWLYWPQSQKPYSTETLNYIKTLDAEKDIALLKLHGWDLSPACIRTLKISTMLLKKGAEKGLTAFSIGRIMCRETLKVESMIEEIVDEAQNSVLPGTSEAAFLEVVSMIMDFQLAKIKE